MVSVTTFNTKRQFVTEKQKQLFQLHTVIEENYQKFLEMAQKDMTLERLTEWRGNLAFPIPQETPALFEGFDLANLSDFFKPHQGVVISETTGALFGTMTDGTMAMYLEIDYRRAGVTAVPHDLAVTFVELYVAAIRKILATGIASTEIKLIHPAFTGSSEQSKRLAEELCRAVRFDGWTCVSKEVRTSSPSTVYHLFTIS